jgi:hypothetical protein
VDFTSGVAAEEWAAQRAAELCSTWTAEGGRPPTNFVANACLVGLAELTVGQITEHDGIGGALELLLHFGDSHGSILAQGLAEFLTHLGIAVDDLHVEPEEMAHLVEGGLEDLDGFHLGLIGQGFHEFGVSGGLHGGAVQFALDHAQVVGNPQNAETNFFHAFAVLVIHEILSVPTQLPKRIFRPNF